MSQSTEDTGHRGFVLARSDVEVAGTDEGAWIGISDSSFTVRGNGAHRLIRDLVAGCDGRATVQDVLDRGPEQVRPVADTLLKALVRRRYVVLLDQPLGGAGAGSAPDPLIRQFAHWTEDSSAAVARLSGKSLRLVGEPGWLERVRSELDGLVPPGLRVEDLPVTPGRTRAPLLDTYPGEPASASWQAGDVVALQADAFSADELAREQKSLWNHGAPHCVAGRIGSRYWLLWSRDGGTGCWRCLRSLALAAEVAAPDTGVGALTDVAGHVSVANLVRSLLARAAGIDDAFGTADALSADVHELSVRTHTVVRRPGCACRCTESRKPRHGSGPAEAVIRRNFYASDDSDRSDEHHAEIMGTLASWTDERVGPFLEIDRDTLPQVPLGAAYARALNLVDEHGGIAATVRTLSSREAYYQAALNVLEVTSRHGAGETDPARYTGAGWTHGEATYRALLRSLPGAPSDPRTMAPLDLDDSSDGECARMARYLERRLGNRGIGGTWLGEHLGNGLCHAALIAEGGPAVSGYGACYGEAVAMALLRTVNDGVLVHVNPHHTTWGDFWTQVTAPVGLEDVSLPFAQGPARIVGFVPESGARRPYDLAEVSVP
ncbi:hypothetical protein [Nocardiopsis alba]|uniref:hypothetical protein n=1 Tax=Nocardiopsis alba TaxID=53437 RepID=UPI00034CC9BF|nr:hypothetical protein [Nocardiopsis alba]